MILFFYFIFFGIIILDENLGICNFNFISYIYDFFQKFEFILVFDILFGLVSYVVIVDYYNQLYSFCLVINFFYMGIKCYLQKNIYINKLVGNNMV